MFLNYFKSALVTVKKHRLFTTINVLGLSIALSVTFIILLYVINELSFNSCHKNSKMVFRVVTYNKEFNNTIAGTPYILAETLKQDFPQIEKATQTRYINDLNLKINNEFLNIKNSIGTGSDIFDIFTIPLVSGSNPEQLLTNENAIVLAQSLALKIFQTTDVIGREIDGIINNVEQTFIVTGIYKDLPQNSSFRPNCMVTTKWTITEMNNIWDINDADKNWEVNSWNTWLLLKHHNQANQIENLMPDFEKKHMNENPNNQYKLQCLSDYYLNSTHIVNTEATGNKENIKVFSLIAFFIILLATLNYILLSTAISNTRSKEIAIRKTNGATINKIKIQIYIESLLISFIALPIAIIILLLAYKHAGELFDTELSFFMNNLWVYTLSF